MAKLFLLGAGGFGTALAVMAQRAGHQVTMWSYKQEEADTLLADGENRRLLPGIPIDKSIGIVTNFAALPAADAASIAVPSLAVRSVAGQLRGHLQPGTVVVCVSKGFEPETLKRMDEVIAEELPENPCVILSGPSHAEEIAKGIPTTVVAASNNLTAAEYVQETLSSDCLRIYVTDDVIGVELGGALKNVIALAAGTLDGLGWGDHTKAALMTRGLTEIARLGVACGARTETFGGLSGMGDLIVTCTSMHSRNRRCGILVGQGLSGREAVAKVGMTVEGYTNTKNAYEMGRRLGVEMPITTEVYRVLYEDKDIRTAIADLMGRPKRHESEYIWLKDSAAR